MTVFKITQLGEPRIVRSRDGQNVSARAQIRITAPTKKGDARSAYLGNLIVQQDGQVSFRITDVNSNAWGRPCWRSSPFDYTRPDIDRFVLKECSGFARVLLSKLCEER